MRNRILGSNNNTLSGAPSATWNLLQLNNKDKNQLILENSFNKELKAGMLSGLSMYSPEIDKWLFKTFWTENEKKLSLSNFDAANNIINSTQKLNTNDIINIGSNKAKKDIEDAYQDIKNIPDKVKKFFNDILEYPILIGMAFLLIITLKK